MSETSLLILTIGHSTRSLDTFIRLLKAHRVSCLVDIRTIPRSKRNPQFNIDTLPDALSTCDIEYIHMAGLGGLRRPRPDSINMAWTNASFRGFADYMQTPEFEQNLHKLMDVARENLTALMCAEVVPWRCHRSLIADALTIRGIQVSHIVSVTRSQPHALTSWAKVDGSKITYP